MTTGSAATARPRVGLLDDHALFRHAMVAVLAAHGIDVVEVDPARDDVLAALGDPGPELVLLDLALADGALGVDLLPDLLDRGLRVLALTGETDPRTKGGAMLGGCQGVLPKAAPLDEIVTAVLEALEGRVSGRYADPAWAAAVRRHRAARAGDLADFERLTTKEGEVLAALVAGHDVAAIASDATVAVTTVRSQVRAVLTKLGVGSQLQAVARARRAGWEPVSSGRAHQDGRFSSELTMKATPAGTDPRRVPGRSPRP